MQSTNDGEKRAVIYVFVASAESGNTQKAELQAEICRTFARRHGWVVVMEYTDIASRDRPQLQRLLDDLDTTKPSAVISLNLSRFGRRFDEVAAVLDRLKASDVELVCPDGSCPAERFELAAMSQVALRAGGGKR